jgi:hypothetical protein
MNGENRARWWTKNRQSKARAGVAGNCDRADPAVKKRDRAAPMNAA